MNTQGSRALAIGVAACVGGVPGSADAAVYIATLTQILTYSNNGTDGRAANITSSTATFTYDDTTSLLTQTGGLFTIRLTTAPTSTLYRTSITGLVIGNGGAATATTYVCQEGNFGTGVGASICGNYNFGANFTNESTTTWGPGTSVSKTIGGDDGSIGAQQSISSLDSFQQVSFVGTTLILSNKSCTNACTTTAGGFNNGQQWTLNAGLAGATDDTANAVAGAATDISILANDLGYTDPVTVTIDSPPDQGGSAVVVGSPGAASGIRITYTAQGNFSGTETFNYRAVGGAIDDVAAVTVTVAAADTVPDAFAFADQPSVPLSSTITSAPITITGTNTIVPISVTGGSYSINGGPFVTAAGTIDSGSTVRVRHTSSDAPDTAVDTVLNVGGVSDTFTSNTIQYAIDDSASTVTNQPVEINVLQNDTGLLPAVFVGIWTDPLHGTASVSGAPGSPSVIRITYTPNPGYSGADSFEYWVETGLIVDYAVVTVDVVNTDTDGDGVLNPVDNCSQVANPSQCDSDGDGYGNRCDGDLTGNGATNAQDAVVFRQQLGKPSVGPTFNKADLNCNGAVNAQDTTLFRQLLGKPPGPSGLVP